MSTVATAAECRTLLMRCINAEYLSSIEARGRQKCPHCDYNRQCDNHFCLLCMEGGLCPMQFRNNNEHLHHPWIQVRKVSHHLVVNANELEHYLGDHACKIQMYRGNNAMIYRLKTKERTGKGKAILRPTDIICGGCNTSISKTSTSNAGVEVCSIECLIKQADRQLQHLALREGVDLREPYVGPMIAQEKLMNKNEVRVPMPVRLLNAPAAAAPQQHMNVINAGDVVVAEENGNGGAQDMEIENHVAVEPEVVADGLWPDLAILAEVFREAAAVDVLMRLGL